MSEVVHVDDVFETMDEEAINKFVNALPKAQQAKLKRLKGEARREKLRKKFLETQVYEGMDCHFYKNKYPEVGDVIMVKVVDIGEMGAYVNLLEYNNIEGMILLSELTRKRIRSVHKLIRVNRDEVVMVLRVDKENGYIDLSKRRVSAEEIAKCEERYSKAGAVHSVMKHVAISEKVDLESVYTSVGWPLYEKYSHAYNAFKLLLTGSDEDIFEGIDISESRKKRIVDYVLVHLAPQPVRIRADFEITCFSYDGIDAIRDSLLLGEASAPAESPITIKYISPPMYVMTCMTLDKEFGIETLNSAIEQIRSSITAKGGSFDVKMAPKCVTEQEESELQQMLDRLAMENEEVSGDEEEA